MNKLWNYISFLGLDNKQKNLLKRSIVLNNQMNFVILTISVLIYLFLAIMNSTDNHEFGIGSFRVFLLILLNSTCLVLSSFKFHKLSKILLIYLSPFIFLLFPTLIGFVEEESFTYYPFVLIAFSILPQLLLIPSEEKILYILSLVYYILLLIFIEPLLVWFMPTEYEIVGIINNFIVFFKIAQISIFIFINLSVFYLSRLNIRFEDELKEKNNYLDIQNEELKTVLDELKETQTELIRSEKMVALGTLTSGVAHEIKNPLNYISGGISMIEFALEQKNSTDNENFISELQEALKVMHRGVDRAEEIINKMNNFSFRKETKLKPTFINELIEETLLLINHELKPDIQVIKEYNLDKIILSNPNKAHHIFLNIILNAVALLVNSNHLSKKIITIQTELEGIQETPMAIIKISNTGPKIPAENIHQVFDPFFTTKDPGEGVGLGLSIAYTFAKELNGDIKVENNSEGVTFTVLLPA